MKNAQDLILILLEGSLFQMFKKFTPVLLVAVVILALVTALIPTGFVSAEDASITLVARYQDDVLVQRDSADSNELATLDPQLASDVISITAIESLFHGLTD